MIETCGLTREKYLEHYGEESRYYTKEILKLIAYNKMGFKLKSEIQNVLHNIFHDGYHQAYYEETFS